MCLKRNTILLLLLLLCVGASIAKDITVDGIVYTVLSNRDKTVTTKVGTSSKPGNTATGALVIPSTVSDASGTYTVVQIGTRGFDGCTGITSVSIPNTVTLIGSSAFFGCTGLTSLEIPGSVATIDLGAFNNCSGITEVTLSEGITYINTDAFKGCTSLETLTLPASLQTIGESAFNGCAALTKINGGNGSYTVSDNAFLNCEKLGHVTLSATTISQNAFKGCSSLTDITFGYNLTAIAANAFSGCDKLTAITCQGVNPSAIETSSFSATALANVTLTIPANTIVDYIGSNWRLFNSFVSGSRKGKYLIDGGLKYLLVNDNDSRYTAMVVNNNYNLTSVSIPEAVTDPADSQDYKITTIAPNAFNGVSRLSQVTTDYRSVIETVGGSAFEGTGLTSFACPPLLTDLSEGVFRNCKSLKEITLNEQLATISRSALEGCENLVSFTMSKMLEEIGPRAFYSCTRLATIAFNENLRSIADSAFMGCGGDWRGNGGIESLVFNDDLETIGDYAFANCGALTSVKFDHALTTIGKGAFSGCGKLAQVTFYDALETLGDRAFANSGVTDIELPSSLEYLGRETFSGCNLAKVSFGDGLKTISPMTFTGSSITELDLGKVRTIADSAFYSCNIPTIRIPSSVKKIGHVAFSQGQSYNVFDVIIEDGIDPLENAERAFDNGENENAYIGRNFNVGLILNLQYTKLVIGNQVTQIPAKAFYTDSWTLPEIALGSSITEIGDSAFYKSTASSIIIPSSVKKIGNDAFYGYFQNEVAVGSGLTEYGNRAIELGANAEFNITAQIPPVLNGDDFGFYAHHIINVQGEQAMQAYKTAAKWSDFRNFELLTVAERIEVEGSIDDLYWEPGDTVRLSAKVCPEDVSLPYVFWRSTDPAVASVDHTGLVTFHDPYEEDENYTPPTQPCRIIAETLYADGPVAEFAVEDAPQSGIDIIVSEEEHTDGPVEIFNIQGIKVGSSTSGLAPGLYIKRQGTVSSKILVR